MSAEKEVFSVLMAEQMSADAAKAFAENETLQGRPTFFYDHAPTSDDIEAEKLNPDVKRMRLVYQPELAPQDIKDVTASGKYDGLMVRPKAVLPGTNVKFAVRVGTGINNFEEWKKEDGHTLMNTPGQNAGATAEYAVKAILRLVAPTQFDRATNELLGESLTSANLSEYFSTELQGKRVAVIGMGDIGMRAAQILKSFGADVIGWGYTRRDGSRSFSQEDAEIMGIEWADTVHDALKGTDAATLHVPGGDATIGLIGEEELAVMNKGAKIVNAARGPVIDAKALDKAIEAGIINGFVADADWFGNYDKDPLGPYMAIMEKYQSRLDLTLFATPHFGGDVTKETNENATTQGLNQLSAAFWDKTIINAKSTIPVGYQNGGEQKPKGIGRVTHAEISSVVAEKAEQLAAAATLIAKLSSKVTSGEVLSSDETKQLMVAANMIAQQLPTGRPVEQSVAL